MVRMGNSLPLGGFRAVFPSLLAAFPRVFSSHSQAAQLWSQRPRRADWGEKLGGASARAVPQGVL